MGGLDSSRSKMNNNDISITFIGDVPINDHMRRSMGKYDEDYEKELMKEDDMMNISYSFNDKVNIQALEIQYIEVIDMDEE
jgi:hypothetical protein